MIIKEEIMLQYTTKNASFLKVYHLLRQKGVKNCTFFLKLYDKTLLNVDPHDEEHLTEDQKNRIIVECTRNPWYFLRECVQIAASGLVPYELHLGNLAFTWAVLNNFNVYMVLPRQRGKTTAAAAIITWILYFGGRNTEIMLFAQTNKNLTNNSGRIKAIRDNLPSYLRLNDPKKDRDGSEMMTFRTLGNKILKQAPKHSEEAADSVGRGFSTPVVWYDEFAFIPHIKAQYQASVLANTTVAKRAAESGLPHSIMLTTTAAFLNTASGIYAYLFFKDSLEFTESMYDLSVNEINDLIDNEAKRNFIRIEYDYWDLGTDDDYFENQCRDLNYEQDAIDREVLNKWKAVSTTHPLGQDAVALLEANVKKPVSIIVINKIYRLKLYKDPSELDWGVPYIIGGDCSNNIGLDYSALVIVDPRNYEIIGTLRSNSYSTMLYANMIVTLMKEYFYKSILVLERNLNGQTILDRMVELDYNLYSRIYATPESLAKGKLGIDTTPHSRQVLYDQVLKIAVDTSYATIHDSTIIGEIKNLIRTRTGRIDHPVGGHDDTLISYLFTRWFMIYGPGIDKYINPLIIGSTADIEGKNAKEIEENRKKRMNSIQQKVDEERTVIKDIFSKNGQSGIKNLNTSSSLDSLKEQNEKLRSGYYEKSFGKTSEQGVFNAANAMLDRYKPEDVAKQEQETAAIEMTAKQHGLSDAKIYTLDPNEIESDDSIESQATYNKNPNDIDYTKKATVVDDDHQLERKLQAEQANTVDDLRWFMGHLR